MELWDLMDRNGNLLGIKHIRGEALPKDTYHLTVEVFTVNSQGQLLLTLRDPHKEMYPNMWEVTGGSAVSGEDSVTAVIRELQEETGITCVAENMRFLMTYPGVSNLMDIYVTFCDAEISELTLQAGETVDAKWVTFEEFEKMIDDGEVAQPVCKRYYAVKQLLMGEIAKKLKV